MAPEDFERVEDKINLIMFAVAEIYEAMPLEDAGGTNISNKLSVIRDLKKTSGFSGSSR